MNGQEAIKNYILNVNIIKKEIAETLEISNKYVSKGLLEDSRYKEEKKKENYYHKIGIDKKQLTI